jgi:hypothetical protein
LGNEFQKYWGAAITAHGEQFSFHAKKGKSPLRIAAVTAKSSEDV